MGGGLSRRGSLYDDDVQYQYGAVGQHLRPERAEMGSGQVPKAKSEAALAYHQRLSGNGVPLRKRQYEGRSKTGTNTPRAKPAARYVDDEDWLARTRAATHEILQEAKGQSWIASRDSSTSLLHLESEDDDAYDDGYEEMAALSASQARLAAPTGALSPSAARVKSPAWGSRYGSRSGSRRTSRRGSFTGSRTPLAAPLALDMTSLFVEEPLATPIEPDFVNAEPEAGEEESE
ncbi:hypothetical protein LTR53_018469, partial [Teratosphaeriaceae sp. CCFEE 6253]